MLPSGNPSVKSVLSGTRKRLDMQETSRLHRAARRLLHILWDCAGATKAWAYIITQWTRSPVSPAQMILYKQAALSRTAPELPPKVRVDIEQMFPDTADIAGRAWTRIWWIACSVCMTTLWMQRNRSVHKQESASAEQEAAEVKQVLLRQLRAVAIKEQRQRHDVSSGVYLRLATEMFQDSIVNRRPVLHSPCNRQETAPGVLEWLRTFQKSCTPSR